MENKQILNSEELQHIVSAAVNAAMDAREGKMRTVLVDRRSAAKRLRVSMSTLWRWDRSGYLKATRIGKAVYYSDLSLGRLERGEVLTDLG